MIKRENNTCRIVQVTTSNIYLTLSSLYLDNDTQGMALFCSKVNIKNTGRAIDMLS